MGSGSARSDVVAENLLKRHVGDLQRSVDEMRAELGRATASERALRSSLNDRKTALRRLLHCSATAGLGLNIPQCGPIRMPVSSDAEREALRTAVEEQLRWNLQLRRDAVGNS